MYSKQEIAMVKKRFWTTFGQYMKPVKGADGEAINWLNYKTGIRQIYFRMDADSNGASVGIELREGNESLRKEQFEKLTQLRNFFKNNIQEEWTWLADYTDEDGNKSSRISTTLANVSILKEEDWPAIISFLKPRIIALDDFWQTAKDIMLA